MQLISVYLYQNKIDVFTNASAAWLTERYRRVYNRNVKIYRGVDNRIDIQVRNSDEKAADTTGSTLVFNLVERESQKLVAKKDCELVDALKGRYFVTLRETDLYDIEMGFYEYSVYNETRSNNNDGTYTVTARTPLYTGSQYDTTSTLEILGSGTGEVLPSTEVREFSLHKSFGEAFDTYYVSSIIDARPQTSTPQSLHTFQFYFTNYTGFVEIQGSISEGGNPEIWTTIEPGLNYNQVTNDFVNVEGKYNFFRIKHTPNYGTSIATFTVAQTILLTYQVDINTRGSGYRVNDTILIKGSRLGGESPTNDLLITVTSVNSSGQIMGINWTGVSYNGVKTFVLSGESSNVGSFDKILYR